MEFETNYFSQKEFYKKYILAAYFPAFIFDIRVEIGIEFKHDGNKLYIRPFFNGWIYSARIPWRNFNFGLEVTSISFYPHSNIINIYNIILM